ncbi:hypothetical protein EDD16DRAFT_1525906 [Pisolithus croceorrhizus]|nr:hypothetical protein EDD16DRAFT_1525906 [Pisolithus croceorrhizus]KAI6169814.1 hypothetical protein EDD17DRAFT_1502731 [Pisolithus thermaeus]
MSRKWHLHSVWSGNLQSKKRKQLLDLEIDKENSGVNWIHSDSTDHSSTLNGSGDPGVDLALSGSSSATSSSDSESDDTDDDSDTDPGDSESSDDNGSHIANTVTTRSQKEWCPPSIHEARHALEDLQFLLKTSKHGSKGVQNKNLPTAVVERVNQMTRFLWAYVDIDNNGKPHPANPAGGCWSKATDQTAQAICFGEKNAVCTSRRLCKWARAYIKDRSNLPVRRKSLRVSLVDDEEVAQELTFHLWHIIS